MSINVIFDSVEQITRGRTNRSLRASEAELSERLKQFTAALPDISSIWILDDKSDAIASSLYFPLPAAANAPDRTYLKDQLASDADIHVGDVLQIKMSGKLIFPVSKRRSDSSGTFAGITEISISPQTIEKFYQPLAARTRRGFAGQFNGEILARYPCPPRPSGREAGGVQNLMRTVERRQIRHGLQRRHVERHFRTEAGGFSTLHHLSLQTSDIVDGWLWHKRYLISAFRRRAFATLILLVMRRTTAHCRGRAAGDAGNPGCVNRKMGSVGQLTGVSPDQQSATIILGTGWH